MMKHFRIVYLILVLLCLFTTSAYADYIQGRIVQIDREKGQVEMVLCEDCSEDGRHPPGADGIIPEGGGEEHVVTVVATWFPRCLSQGMMIFARGTYKVDDGAVFEAEEVFPLRKLGREDKTGVRSRFRHHGGRQHYKGNHEE